MRDPVVCTCIHTAFEKDTCDLHVSHMICLDVAGLRTSEIRKTNTGELEWGRQSQPRTLLQVGMAVEQVLET
jgi:hypothetical protein